MEPEAVKPIDKDNPYSVSGLTREIKKRLETIAGVWLTGEISNIKYHTSQHIYLTLKDSENQIAAVIWRSTAKNLQIELRDGMEVLVCGDLAVYGPQSKYQLTISAVELRGTGALLLAFERLKKKLLQLGLFDPAHKKPLPKMPRKICVVTSPTSAAIQDILNVIENRFPPVAIYIYPVRVQGDGASQEIAAAIHTINHHPALSDVEVMIVGRGGGSLEDLWAFNEENVAYAIYESRIPVISAVGHEIDVTIADLVADRRALTPTEAGKVVVPNLEDIHRALEQKRRQLELAVHNRTNLSRSSLARLSTHRAFARPLDKIRHSRQQIDIVDRRLQSSLERRVQKNHISLAQISGKLLSQEPSVKIRRHRQRLDELAQRLGIAVGKRLEWDKRRLANYEAQLEALSPLSVLRRGYSITYIYSGDGVVRDHSQVAPGDRIWTRMAHSWILSKVEKTGTKSADT